MRWKRRRGELLGESYGELQVELHGELLFSSQVEMPRSPFAKDRDLRRNAVNNPPQFILFKRKTHGLTTISIIKMVSNSIRQLKIFPAILDDFRRSRSDGRAPPQWTLVVDRANLCAVSARSLRGEL